MLVRTKLAAAIGAHNGPVLIEAGAGAGKSVLLGQLIDLDPARWIGVDGGPDAGVELERALADGLRVAVDNAHLLDDAGLDRLAAAVSRACPIVVAGRVLPPQLWQLAASRRETVEVVDASALFFDRGELATLTGDPSAAASVERLTAGWPLASSTIVERAGAERPGRGQVARQGTVIDGLLGGQLVEVPDADRVALGLLGHCRDFTPTVADRLETGLLTRVKLAGVPMFRRSAERYEIPLPVRQALRRLIDLDNDQLEPLVAALGREGAVETALDVCAQRGWTDRAARLLADLDPDQLYSFDPDMLPSVLSVLGSDLHHHPAAMLAVARIQFISGDVEDVRRSLTIALDALGSNDPAMATSLHHEVLAELAYLEFESSNFDDAAAWIARCREVIDPTGRTAANARLNEAVASLLASRKGSEELLEARELLVDAMNVWNGLGFVTRAGMTLRMMVWFVLFELGQFGEALKLLDRALATGGTTAAETAMNQLLRARALGCLGRVADARLALDEAERLVEGLDLTWVQGFAAWIDGVNASYQGAGDQVGESIKRAERLLGELTTGSTGGLFRCEAALALARCDRGAAASAQLRAATGLDGVDASDLARAEAGVAARTGDPDAGLRAIDGWRSAHVLSPIDAWRATLWSAGALARLGRFDRAEERLVEAEAMAVALGQPALAEHMEAGLPEAIGRLADRAGDTSSPYRIQLFGPFRVTRDGVDCRLTRGHAQTVIKLLALRGGRLHVEEVIDALWPSASVDVGRRRLRNVLRRLRTACGPLVQRDGQFLSLSPNESDYQRAMHSIDGLTRSAEPSLPALIDLAAVLEPEFLEADRFESWAELPRANVEQGRLRVLDRLTVSAIEAGQLDRAVEAAARAIELDPFGQHRIDRAVSALSRRGREDLVERLLVTARSAQGA